MKMPHVPKSRAGFLRHLQTVAGVTEINRINRLCFEVFQFHGVVVLVAAAGEDHALVRRMSSGVVPLHVRFKYWKAPSALCAKATPPPESMEMPPGCGIFSINKTFAPASCAVIAEMPPAAP